MKRQILMRFMTIITVTVLLVIGILSFVTYNYYYVTATDVLKRHANASAVLFANSGLAYDYADSETTIHDVLDSYAYPDAEIEVLDATGIPRYSSTGFISERKLTREAINQVRAGQTVTKRYDDEATGEHLLEVTEPVVSFGQTTGALRYTTSLERIDRRVIEICLAIVLLGTVIWGLAFIYSSRLVSSIVRPIQEVIGASDQIAKQHYDVKVNEEYSFELGELARTINYMGQQIKQQETLKDEFISGISHELRTPLTSIKGWSETLLVEQDQLPEEASLGMGIIHSETERLISLVEQLLDFSKLETSRLVLYRQEVNLTEIIETVTAQLRQKLEEKNVQIVQKLPAQVVGLYDENRLKQVFLNLLDNAIRFSPVDGTITIRLVRSERVLFLSFSDEGPGIPKEHLRHVTEKFYQVQKGKGGTGLGLSICRELVEAHEGKLFIDNQPEGGVIATILLPVTKA